eukprot:6202426-Pleurochrysis_carterae.AAC.1
MQHAGNGKRNIEHPSAAQRGAYRPSREHEVGRWSEGECYSPGAAKRVVVGHGESSQAAHYQQPTYSCPTPPFIREGMEVAALRQRAQLRREDDEARLAALQYKMSKYQHW